MRASPVLLAGFVCLLYLVFRNGEVLRTISRETVNDIDLGFTVPMQEPATMTQKVDETPTKSVEIPSAMTSHSVAVETHNEQPAANQNCGRFEGILLITHLGMSEGTGTAFFNLVLDQLIYAEMYNLQPMILPDNASAPCYDPNVHNQTETWVFPGSGEATPFMGSGSLECRLTFKGHKRYIPHPGSPQWKQPNVSISVIGNNLWNTYFQPLHLSESSICRDLPIVNLQSFITMPGLHKCAPFGVRSWPFRGMPSALMPNSTLQEWFHPMRQRASQIVKSYFYLQPSIEELVIKANPTQNRSCVALHIRATDKGHGRKKVPLNQFRRYIKAYNGDVYLATDDAKVVTTVSGWMKNGQQLRYQQDAFRSTSSEPTFTLMKNNTHRTNVESLVDIYAMARCSSFVHGFSAMAEAVIYLNLNLHHRSVNLDDPGRMSAKQFRFMAVY